LQAVHLSSTATSLPEQPCRYKTIQSRIETICIFVACCIFASIKNKKMTTEQNKAIVTRVNKEYIEGGNTSTVYELFAPDFINQTAPPGTPQGPEAIIFFFDNILRPAFPNLKVVIHDQVAEGDRVTTRKSFHATHKGEFFGVPATNKEVVIDVLDIIRLRDGKFLEHWGIMDTQGLMAQITSN
jgi:predicted ester cyclase